MTCGRSTLVHAVREGVGSGGHCGATLRKVRQNKKPGPMAVLRGYFASLLAGPRPQTRVEVTLSMLAREQF